MDTVRRLRAMAQLCRQTATHHPDRSWKLLAEAEYWEHLADGVLPARSEQCETGGSPSIEYSERSAAAASRLGARLIC